MALSALLSTTADISYSSTDARDFASTTEEYSTKKDSQYNYLSSLAVSQVDRIYSDRRHITPASGTDDLNLSSLTDPIHGQTINFDRIKAIYVKNQEPIGASGAKIRVGGRGTSAAWIGPFRTNADYIELGPQDEILLTRKETGFDCPTSASILRITHNGGSSGTVEYDIIIGGTV